MIVGWLQAILSRTILFQLTLLWRRGCWVGGLASTISACKRSATTLKFPALLPIFHNGWQHLPIRLIVLRPPLLHNEGSLCSVCWF
jgi:hypothetical protein